MSKAPRLALVALACCLVFIYPVGFVGRGSDDGHYLQIAECWVRYGPCLPSTHWGGRWPLLAPLSGLVWAFGEQRWALGLTNFAASAWALAMLLVIGQRHFDQKTGIVAAALLAITPAFALQVFQPNIDGIDLALILTGFALAQRDFWSGFAFGLAFQARETSLGAAIIAGAASRKPAFAIGFLVPLAVEFLIFWRLTGDPLYRRKLSLHHTQVYSTDLLVGTAADPLLNTQIIGGWKRAIQIHWTIDGMLNLLADPKSGFLFIAAPALMFTRPPEAQKCWHALGAGAFYFAFLTYVLAVNPSPRLMLFPLACCALVAAHVLTARARPVVFASVGAFAFISTLTIAIQPRYPTIEALALRMVYNRSVSVEPRTREYLAFTPEIAGLPTSGRPYQLSIGDNGCDPNGLVRSAPTNDIAHYVGGSGAICLRLVEGSGFSGSPVGR